LVGEGQFRDRLAMRNSAIFQNIPRICQKHHGVFENVVSVLKRAAKLSDLPF